MEQNKIIYKLLRTKGQKKKMFGAWAALCLGLLLLFVALLAWVDFQHLLNDKNQKDAMAEFLVIGKKITNENMGFDKRQNFFTPKEIQDLKQEKNIKAVGSVYANQFPVSAAIGGDLGFRTELFLSSIDNQFMDVMPQDWEWQPGAYTVPIILSNDFLNLYNYGFALSQGYPQLSQKSIQAIPFQIIIANGKERFNAQIVGFTNRLNSLLVPENFMDTMNKKYGLISGQNASRLILKVKDPSDKNFIELMQQKNYTVNADQLRWSRIRTAVQAIVSLVGLIALIIAGMAVLSFMLFLEITIYRSANHIQLLKQIGYAPNQLRKTLIGFFLPWLVSALIVAVIIAFSLQIPLVEWTKRDSLQLQISDAWILVFPFFIFLVFLYFLLQKAAKTIFKRV